MRGRSLDLFIFFFVQFFYYGKICPHINKSSHHGCKAPEKLTEEDTFLRAIALVPEAFRSPEDSEQKVIPNPHLSLHSLLCELCASVVRLRKGRVNPDLV